MNFFFLIYILLFSIAIGGGSSSRGGGSSSRGGGSSSRGGGSSSRGGGSSSRGGGSGSSSSSRFSFSRSTGYRYGTYSGTRYGTTIRRTVYWPIYRIGFGYPYRYNYYNSYYYYNQRPNNVSNLTDAPGDISISDSYTKMVNVTDISYNCINADGSVAASCFEPVSYSENSNLFIDGCCCENTTSSQAICCLVELDSSLSKSSQLFKIYVTLTCLTVTSVMLILRICR